MRSFLRWSTAAPRYPERPSRERSPVNPFRSAITFLPSRRSTRVIWNVGRRRGRKPALAQMGVDEIYLGKKQKLITLVFPTAPSLSTQAPVAVVSRAYLA